MDPGAGSTVSGDSGREADEQFRALYVAHAERVYGYCLRRLGFDRTLAEDVTADVFVVAWRRISEMPPPPQDRLFLYAIARRQLSNQRRGLRRLLRLQRRISLQPLQPPETEGDVTSVRRDRLRTALEALPPGQQDALILVVLEGLSHAEAGQVLGCSENAVAVRLHKARAVLRERIADGTAPESRQEPIPITSEGAVQWT